MNHDEMRQLATLLNLPADMFNSLERRAALIRLYKKAQENISAETVQRIVGCVCDPIVYKPNLTPICERPRGREKEWPFCAKCHHNYACHGGTAK